MAETATPVDLEGFRAAMRLAGVEEVVEPTLEIYVEEAGALFDRIVEASRAGDLEGVRAGAHSLKSSSANIRAHRLAELFGALEGEAQMLDHARVKASLEQLEREFERVMAYLGAEPAR